ncbi:MFS transporter [Saccharothrix australiensis]|uniref:Putative MFS family arabinose efflux permease n=1 Tax=Saccharothrix australiensis TaxID=2072 RepID=A0A495W0P0_9PSEU|nr:MFS transporter [Saccharothrix australiensis]RKT54577.1 putative MFS family arabinose efflux permease [Saccharothrix australiensis]
MNVRHVVLIVCLNLAQLPVAMRLLLVTLLAADRTGSFAVAGLAGGTAAVGTALTAPWWSRLLPRFGDGRVLVASGGLFLCGQLALAVSHGTAPIIGLAAVSGLCTPPAAGSVRALLPRLVPPADLTRSYAVNSVALEVVYLGGPLWVTGWVALAGPTAALVASTVIGVGCLVVGGALAPSGRRRSPSPGPPLLAEPAVHTLGGAYLVYWVCMGAMWVLLPAFAERAGAAGQAGLLVALWSAGSLVGGLVLAARPPRGSKRNSYLWLLGTLAATSLLLVPPTTVGGMAVSVSVFGVALAPWLAVNDQLVAASAVERTAELYGWLTTAGQLGSAVGSAVAGPLADRYGGGPAFLLVTAALGTGFAIALRRRRTLPDSAPT